MKFKKKLLAISLFALLIALLAAMSVFADESGYLFDSDGTTRTNIKWTFTTEGSEKICTFEIDEGATANKASTVIYSFDPVTGVKGDFYNPIQTGWGATTGVTKIVIKEGITAIKGGFLAMNRSIKRVEIPTSLTEINGEATFEGCRELVSIYVAGTAPVEGTFDLSGIKSLGGNGYMFDGCIKVSSIKFNSELASSFETESLKNTQAITSLEIPAGVPILKNKSLAGTNALKTLTILGMDTVIESDTVFNGNTSFPAIKAPAGSKAAEFAKANGYTFIDLETGEETKGTKPAPGEASTDPTPSTPTTPSSSYGLEQFDQNACTAYGYVGGQYYDVYWVYYQDTKTLKFFANSNTGAWIETGRIDKCEDTVGWSAYKEEIEYIVVGPRIQKITGGAFDGHTALKEVNMGTTVYQVDPGAFSNCPNLVSVYSEGQTKVEGRIDFSKVPKVKAVITTGTPKIKEILLSRNTIQIDETLGFNMRDIYAHTITDALKTYVKENSYNLINAGNPEEKYEHYVEVPDDITMCGDRCGFGFDAATGTLTIYGSGGIADIVNYYGGGSKNSPWFEIKKDIKHVVITDNITSLGKYAFAQCENLETVQLPASDNFELFNAAFEKCHNLKSVYRKGSEPIEGTLDLRGIKEIKAWTFAYDYLIANVIISPDLVVKVDGSAFEENTNLAAIYGTPGSFAEQVAADFGVPFLDIGTNTPAPVTCTPPETTNAYAPITEAPPMEDDTDESKAPESEAITTEDPLFSFETDETTKGEDDETTKGDDESTAPVTSEVNGTEEKDDGSMLPVIIGIAVAVIVVAAVAVVIIKKKKA